MNYENSYKKIENLPIHPYLDDLCEVLKSSPSHFMVLTAETGAGKSTAVPLALLKNFSGNILMLENRRLAVLNIANRVSFLLDEEVGQTCGYAIHLEHKTSSKTRFTLLTQAILTRKLQSDPSLEGISVVVIDEFHERSIHADLALAFLKETLQLRDDLYVIVMSATMDSKKLSEYLGVQKEGTVVPCPIYTVKGRTFPVQIEYDEKSSVAQAVLNELHSSNPKYSKGSVLVFLPGINEIKKTFDELTDKTDSSKAEILILHSSVPFEEQKKVLSVPKDSKKRRIILSSSIAETSVTVPDVTVVIDCGYMRLSSFNGAAGMSALVTQRESLFNAEQRAGRAGRLQEGKCVRLWNKSDVLELSNPPEILRTDLVPLVLECAEWGVSKSDGLSWLTPPPATTWQTSKNLLEQLNCLNSSGITQLGKASLSLGIHPRLACTALSGAAYGNPDLSTDLAVKYDSSISANLKLLEKSKAELKKRVQKAVEIYNFSSCFPQEFSSFSTSYALLCGYPDRIAVLQEAAEPVYRFPSGRLASLQKETPRPYPKYIIAVEVDAGEKKGKIYSFQEINEQAALNFLFSRAQTICKTEFAQGTDKLCKTEYTAYGKLVLKEKNIPVTQDDYADAVADCVKNNGLEWLSLSGSCKNFLLRVQFFIQNAPQNKGDGLSIKFKNLSSTANEWLKPFISSQNIQSKTVYDALYWFLDGSEICSKVPSELSLENGRRLKICYEEQNSKIIPTAQIIIQQIFGCLKTPKILGVPVLLKLLSPARRPLQITTDLENFWKETWPEICSEMKGRYPKHNWDYRVAE